MKDRDTRQQVLRSLNNLNPKARAKLEANPRFRELLSAIERREAVKENSDKLEEVDPPASALPDGRPLVKTVESISGEEENRSAADEAEPSDEKISSLLANGSTVRALARSANRNPRREIVTKRADHITPRKLHWLWPERIPLGKVTVFAGLPGQGKSLATVDIAARLTTAREYPDSANPLAASEVLFVAGEDDPEDALVPRLMAAGADCSRIHWLKGVRDSGRDDSLRLDMDTAGIERFLDDRPAIRLFVLDPISNHLGSASMVDEQEVRGILGPLTEVAKDRDISIICVMHMNKKEGLAPIHRVSGAGAFIGVARASWLFAPDPETQSHHLMMPLKNNYAKDPSSLVYRVDERNVEIENAAVPIPCIEWGEETDVNADEIVSAPRKSRSGVAKTFLMTFLAKGPQDASIVYEAAKKEGISERTLERVKTEAGVESQKKGDGWEWSLGGNR